MYHLTICCTAVGGGFGGEGEGWRGGGDGEEWEWVIGDWTGEAGLKPSPIGPLNPTFY